LAGEGETPDLRRLGRETGLAGRGPVGHFHSPGGPAWNVISIRSLRTTTTSFRASTSGRSVWSSNVSNVTCYSAAIFSITHADGQFIISRGIRNRFSKADQDQLGLFLATHPGDRSGNAIYQEFAQTVEDSAIDSCFANFVQSMFNLIICLCQKNQSGS
ncbi:hypothetical protein VP01_1456g2, partial [Puccinia sorghi]